MNGFLPAMVYAALAAVPILVGGLLAVEERLLPGWLDMEVRHTVNALVGGILLAAVGLVLVPHGIEALPVGAVVAAMGCGGLAFLLIDRALALRGTRASVLMALLLDFVPEAMALGAMLATGEPAALLLVLLIGTQNLPEGFTALRELTRGRHALSTRRGLWLLAACALLGPLAALAGHRLLADQPEVLGAIMLAAAGGILYLTFQDIAPKVPLRRAWAPPLGAVAGFLVGVVGQMMLVA